MAGDGDVGSCPDEIQLLRAENQELKGKQDEMLKELSELRKQLPDLSLGGSADEDAEQPEEITNEAVRKRLARLCNPKSNGNLILQWLTLPIFLSNVMHSKCSMQHATSEESEGAQAHPRDV